MIDIIIPNYNGAAHLPTCLEALRRQTRQDFCVVVVDDGSTDESRDLLARFYPEVQVIALPQNRGLAAAVNAAFHATGGEYVVLLNNDTFCRPDFLEHVAAAFDDERVGAVAPLTVRSDGRTIDSVGLTVDATLAPFIRLTGHPIERAASERPLLVSPGGGADAYRRTAWTEAAGLDERLSFYGSDLDLALRLRSLGRLTVAAPPSKRCTVPCTRSPFWAAYSSKVALHSASRIF